MLLYDLQDRLVPDEAEDAAGLSPGEGNNEAERTNGRKEIPGMNRGEAKRRLLRRRRRRNGKTAMLLPAVMVSCV